MAFSYRSLHPAVQCSTVQRSAAVMQRNFAGIAMALYLDATLPCMPVSRKLLLPLSDF
jgi:hypothetical protein